MNTVLIPPAARTDVPRDGADPTAGAPTGPLAVRLAGIAVIVLTSVFVTTVLLPWPAGANRSIPAEFGDLALLVAFGVPVVLAWRTRGSGAGAWRPITAFAGACVTVAVAMQLVAMVHPGGPFTQVPWLLAGGAAILVGVGVSAAGRWRGALRYLPLAAHAWLFAFVAALAARSDDVAWLILFLGVAIGQAALGLALAVAPHAVSDRTEGVAR